MSNQKLRYSVVVPMFNEEGNAGPLFDEIKAVMDSLKGGYEIIIVDDASRDGTYEELKTRKPLRIVRMRRNSGQSSAMDAGIKRATGEILITMDGDGQDDPKNIPLLLKKLHDDDLDVVCAWRHKRKDSEMKRFLSWGWRELRSVLIEDGVHDAGTQFRVYKREVFDGIDLYGEMHRFIPALLKWRGYKIDEVRVNHRPRIHGSSKYNWKRPIKGFADLLYMWMWRKYHTRPLHLFGSLGIFSVMFGFLILLALAYLRLFEGYYLSNKIWPLVGFFFVMIGLQMFATGIIAAHLLELSDKPKYYVRDEVELK